MFGAAKVDGEVSTHLDCTQRHDGASRGVSYLWIAATLTGDMLHDHTRVKPVIGAPQVDRQFKQDPG